MTWAIGFWQSTNTKMAAIDLLKFMYMVCETNIFRTISPINLKFVFILPRGWKLLILSLLKYMYS